MTLATLCLALVLGLAAVPAATPARHVSRAVSKPSAVVATAAPDSAPPRLPRDVAPVSEAVELTLDPEKADYQGRVTVRLEVVKPARELRFHARALTIDRATLEGPAGAIRVASTE